MKKLVQTQVLPISIDEAWDFFSSPQNLNLITPPDMTFHIISDIPATMYEGMFITYKISPVPLLRFLWCTEITHIKPGAFFVDEQRIGPYRIWHHEHHFEPHPNGVLMTDILHYRIGKGMAGWIAGKVFVHQKVNAIFKFRYQKLQELFPVKH